MKYRAKCTNIVSQIKNITAYSKSYICHDAKDHYIEVDTEDEAELIEELNEEMTQALKTYKKLMSLTIK